MVTEACLYHLQALGEAITKLTDDIKNNEPKIPRTLIKGMRNRLIHEYFATDLHIVWDAITKEIPLIKPL